ncbi:MAG: hypothetical protein PHN40_09460 [Dysgonamonadaceae bacterium]|nr:hypothetical protein [Patescibacteria group bacterium]MDD3728552.1 hypothetical protein [Dysgonamonadaceae bacterium]
MENNEEYQIRRDNALNFYNKINSVFSPVLQTKITFPAESFNHIVFKNARSERERSSQALRFKLLPLAAKLIELSTTYQEYEESPSEVIIKRHKKKIRTNRTIKYWGIIAILDGQKIKVILRKIGDNGSAHFWSIIPAWTTNKYRDTKFYTTMKGCPAED